jgi:hypothetical protein
MSDALDAFRVPRDVRRADGRLADALDAVAEINADELDDEVAADIQDATRRLLKAKGHVETRRNEVFDE